MRVAMAMAEVNGPSPAVALKRFGASTQVERRSEVAVRGVPLRGGVVYQVKGEKVMHYAFVPFSETADGDVQLIAIDVAYDGAAMQAWVSGLDAVEGAVTVRGEFDPATPWLSNADLIRVLEADGHRVAEQFHLVAPFLEGRLAWWQEKLSLGWWFVFMFLSFAVTFLWVGVRKLWMWLSRIQSAQLR